MLIVAVPCTAVTCKDHFQQPDKSACWHVVSVLQQWQSDAMEHLFIDVTDQREDESSTEKCSHNMTYFLDSGIKRKCINIPSPVTVTVVNNWCLKQRTKCVICLCHEQRMAFFANNYELCPIIIRSMNTNILMDFNAINLHFCIWYFSKIWRLCTHKLT